MTLTGFDPRWGSPDDAPSCPETLCCCSGWHRWRYQMTPWASGRSCCCCSRPERVATSGRSCWNQTSSPTTTGSSGCGNVRGAIAPVARPRAVVSTTVRAGCFSMNRPNTTPFCDANVPVASVAASAVAASDYDSFPCSANSNEN